MKTGEVVKYIRISKRLKSKIVYADILSRPVISKFEKGISDTTTEKFFEILKNLNVTLEEFYYIYNGFILDVDKKFISDYAQAFYSTDKEALKILYNEIKDKYIMTSQIKYLHYSLLTELTIQNFENGTYNNNSLEILKKYLMNCDDWTYYEIMLFTNLLDFFPLNVIDILYKRAKKKLIYFKKIKIYRNDLFSLITNILVLHIKENNVTVCRLYYSDLSKNLSKTNNLMYEKTMLLFFQEIINIMENEHYNSNKVDEIIKIFDFLELPFRKQQCIDLLKLVKYNNIGRLHQTVHNIVL